MTKPKVAPTKGKVEEKVEEKTFEKAFIVPAELGEKILNFLGELPYKYKQGIDPLVQGIIECPRSDLKVKMTPDV